MDTPAPAPPAPPANPAAPDFWLAAPPIPPVPSSQRAGPPPDLGLPSARNRRWRRAGVGALVAAVMAGGAAGGVVGRLSAPDASATSTASRGSEGTGSLADNTDIHAVLAAVQPAVVSVRTQAYQRGRFYPTQGAGSGVILTADGEVLTNAHVVSGASTIEVTLNGERNGRAADLIGVDSSADVALLKIRDAEDLPTVTLGRSSDLRVGDSVVAIGNALDLGSTPTVTQGIVSAVNRSIEAPGERFTGLIQTDAAINPGNSGGPLVDAQGRVVGVNTVVAGDAQNIGFALAIDDVKAVIDELRTEGGQPITSLRPRS